MKIKKCFCKSISILHMCTCTHTHICTHTCTCTCTCMCIPSLLTAGPSGAQVPSECYVGGALLCYS